MHGLHSKCSTKLHTLRNITTQVSYLRQTALLLLQSYLTFTCDKVIVTKIEKELVPLEECDEYELELSGVHVLK